VGKLTALEESEIPLRDGTPTVCIDAWIPHRDWMIATLYIYQHDGQGIN
jgi:hypothetical protein